jgi:hypothetical protein
MRAKSFFIILLFSLVLFSACQSEVREKETTVTGSETSTDSATIPSQKTQFEEFTANFEIYTLGTKRIFTLPMYHNQSADVFIEVNDPSLIQVKRDGVTWNEFFETLPFSLTKECLITGTKQTLCTNDNYELRFILNSVYEPNSLDLPISENDYLVVEYIKK